MDHSIRRRCGVSFVRDPPSRQNTNTTRKRWLSFRFPFKTTPKGCCAACNCLVTLADFSKPAIPARALFFFFKYMYIYIYV